MVLPNIINLIVLNVKNFLNLLILKIILFVYPKKNLKTLLHTNLLNIVLCIIQILKVFFNVKNVLMDTFHMKMELVLLLVIHK